MKEAEENPVEEKIIEEVKIEEAPIIAGVIKEKKSTFEKESWHPKTDIGKKVKNGEISELMWVLDAGIRILEPEITDALLPNLEMDLINFGQSKGKFGGGKRSIWRQTQKKTNEGNKPKFAALVIVGDKDGYLGLGGGKSKETVPAREKALKNAKLNMIRIKRGCGSWECDCREPHSIPFAVEGKCGSVKIILKPAPKGTDLKVEKECQKMLRLVGIKDVYSKTFGQTRTKLNLINACFDALKQLSSVKVKKEYESKAGMKE